jgi:hypothetical protein
MGIWLDWRVISQEGDCGGDLRDDGNEMKDVFAEGEVAFER